MRANRPAGEQGRHRDDPRRLRDRHGYRPGAVLPWHRGCLDHGQDRPRASSCGPGVDSMTRVKLTRSDASVRHVSTARAASRPRRPLRAEGPERQRPALLPRVPEHRLAREVGSEEGRRSTHGRTRDDLGPPVGRGERPR